MENPCDNPDKANENEFVEVLPSGERKPVTIAHESALTFATEAAKAFGVGASQSVDFDKERAKRDVKGEGDTKKTKKTKDKKAEAKPDNPEVVGGE
jgi:CRISPR-associated protein Csb1